MHSLRYSSITANKNWILISGTHICIPEGIVTCSPNYQIRSFFLSYPSQVFRGWGKCLVDVADTWALIGRPSLILIIYLISVLVSNICFCVLIQKQVHLFVSVLVALCQGKTLPGVPCRTGYQYYQNLVRSPNLCVNRGVLLK